MAACKNRTSEGGTKDTEIKNQRKQGSEEHGIASSGKEHTHFFLEKRGKEIRMTCYPTNFSELQVPVHKPGVGTVPILLKWL